MPADLQQNISVMISLLFLHNFAAFFYFGGLILALLWSLYKPSRAITLCIIGFGLLLFSFEYTKHIVDPLKDQTMNSLITIQEHAKVRRVVNLSLIKLTPFVTFFGGWIFLIAGIVFFTSEKKILKYFKK